MKHISVWISCNSAVVMKRKDTWNVRATKQADKSADSIAKSWKISSQRSRNNSLRVSSAFPPERSNTELRFRTILRYVYVHITRFIGLQHMHGRFNCDTSYARDFHVAADVIGITPKLIVREPWTEEIPKPAFRYRAQRCIRHRI